MCSSASFLERSGSVQLAELFGENDMRFPVKECGMEIWVGVRSSELKMTSCIVYYIVVLPVTSFKSRILLFG